MLPFACRYATARVMTPRFVICNCSLVWGLDCIVVLFTDKDLQVQFSDYECIL
ncbi:hypothetical protein FQN60_005439 [Etheostoma spectabile]|uniref:Uncharacterized protein n=1 Tax=Etheostoma spectabile TaxID=54343 RepID=A0A5J5CD98_9PERO|nr:hypothetical protein FQN60_005439 [Etheostoma spectabile]